MNIKELKNKNFIDFASEMVGYKVGGLRPNMARSSGTVVLEFSDADNGFVQSAHEKFTFTSVSCIRHSNIVGIQDLSKQWAKFTANLNCGSTATNDETAGV